MKVYEKLVDKDKLQKNLINTLKSEYEITGEYTKVYSDMVEEELYNIFEEKLENILNIQKELKNIRKDKKISKIDNKVLLSKLKIRRYYLKNLNKNLEKYNKILDLYIIAKKYPNWAYKILDKDEFNNLLDLDIDLFELLYSFQTKKDNFYKDILLRLRNIIHEIDLEESL